jgi:NAD binding domain of 6-phosphogluconate dehydrogenase
MPALPFQCTRSLGRHCRAYSTRLESQRHKHIAFIGLGRMGFEMALNLFSKTLASTNDAGFVICDTVPASTQSFRDRFLAKFPGAHVRIVTTPEEYVGSDIYWIPLIISEPCPRAALASRIVITMLPSSPQVQAVYSETSGIISALKALPSTVAQNTLCIDSTTLDVDVARSVAREVNQTGAQMVDAPVSGGKFALISSGSKLMHTHRCHRCNGRHTFISRWGHQFGLSACEPYPFSHGKTDHSLRPIWCRSRSQDLQ